MPASWITADGRGVTEDLVRYMRPLVQGELNPIYVEGLPRHIYLQ